MKHLIIAILAFIALCVIGLIEFIFENWFWIAIIIILLIKL